MCEQPTNGHDLSGVVEQGSTDNPTGRTPTTQHFTLIDFSEDMQWAKWEGRERREIQQAA
jgi:hypothetical protein